MWISVNDKLPNDGDIVMTYGAGCANSEYCQAYYFKNSWQELDCCGDFFDVPATHWQPLPPPPNPT